MTDEKKGMLAAGIAYSIFGTTYLFSKIALGIAEPAILLCVRFAVTFAVLNGMVLTGAGKINFKGKRLFGPLVLGLLQPVLYFLLENYGLKYTTTSFSGILSSSSPILSAILGAILLRERPTGRQWLCVCVSIAGVLMVSLGATDGVNTTIGCLCLLGAFFCGSLYSVLVRKLSREFTSFEMTYLMFAVGCTFFLIYPLIRYGTDAFSMLSAALSRWEFVGSAVYLGAFASVGAYLLVNYSLTRLPVTRSAIFNTFSTLISVLSGVVILHDPFTWTSGAAFLLILLGVWGVNRFAAQPTDENPQQSICQNHTSEKPNYLDRNLS